MREEMSDLKKKKKPNNFIFSQILSMNRKAKKWPLRHSEMYWC